MAKSFLNFLQSSKNFLDLAEASRIIRENLLLSLISCGNADIAKCAFLGPFCYKLASTMDNFPNTVPLIFGWQLGRLSLMFDILNRKSSKSVINLIWKQILGIWTYSYWIIIKKWLYYINLFCNSDHNSSNPPLSKSTIITYPDCFNIHYISDLLAKLYE